MTVSDHTPHKEHIRVTRSFVAAGALAEVIDAEYAFDAPVSCKLFSKLLRTQDNDHYQVSAGSATYVARVYQLGKHLHRSEPDYLYELDWLTFLHDKGLSVSYPIARRDGSLIGRLNTPEGDRYYALFSMAPGRPMHPDNVEQLFALGRHMASIHLASNEYEPRYARKPIDLAFLVDEPVARLTRFWDESRVFELDILQTSAADAKAELQKLLDNEQETADGWGPIGGDFHSASTFFTADDKPTFFNFDLCGPGWRAYDIATFLLNTDLLHQPEALSEAFFAGYYSVRPLSENEHAAIAPFLTIRRIWLTGLFSREDGMVGHTFLAPAASPTLIGG